MFCGFSHSVCGGLKSPLECIHARTVLKNIGAGPVKSAIVVMFCINLILAYEASFCVRTT